MSEIENLITNVKLLKFSTTLHASACLINCFSMASNLITHDKSYFLSIQTPYAPTINGALALFCLGMAIKSALDWKNTAKKLELAKIVHTFS